MIEQILHVDDRVKFEDDGRWWTVRALDTRYVILTRQAEFYPAGTSAYTIIDWDRELRGPCNRLGQGWDVDAEDGPERLLAALRATGIERVEVSYRNNVAISIEAIRPA